MSGVPGFELMMPTVAEERRSGADALVMADLVLLPMSREAFRAGRRLDLNEPELGLLELLLRHARAVVPKDTISRALWSDLLCSRALDCVIDVHAEQLRRKIDDGCPIALLHPVRGIGYLMSDRQPGSQQGFSAGSDHLPSTARFD